MTAARVFAAFACMLCGATVSMMSGLALAVRDMSRNSFAEHENGKSLSQVVVRDLIDPQVRELPGA